MRKSAAPGENAARPTAWALTLLDDDQVEDGQVAVHDAAADRLAAALALSAGPVAGVALGQEEADAAVGQDALLHGEALLVVAAADAHNVALPKKERPQRSHFRKKKWTAISVLLTFK